MEQTGSIIMQSLSGILLDIKSGKREINSLQYLLNIFVLLNVLQGGSIWLFAYLQYRGSSSKGEISRDPDSFAMESIPNRAELSETNAEFVTPLLNNDDDSVLSEPLRLQARREINASQAKVRRGKLIACTCVAFVIFAWVLVMGLALEDFKQRKYKK